MAVSRKGAPPPPPRVYCSARAVHFTVKGYLVNPLREASMSPDELSWCCSCLIHLWRQLSWAAAALCNCPSSPSSLFGGKSCWFTLQAGAAVRLWWRLLGRAAPNYSPEKSWGEVKRREKVGAWGRSHCSIHVSTSPLEMLTGKIKDKSDGWLCLQEDGIQSRWYRHLTDPGLRPCCFWRHLQQALILAAVGHANKKDSMTETAGWTTRMPGPSRAERDAEYRYRCLFAVTVDIVVIISRSQRTISASCPAATPSPCSGISIHPVRCSVVLQRWFSTYGSLNHSGP